MKKPMVLIIVIVIVVLVVIGAVVGYLYFSGKFNGHARFPGRGGQFNASRNIQLNQSQIDEVTSFFNSNPTQQQITDYCNTNRMNCFYYCMNIDKTNSYCKQLATQRPGNYTGRGRGNYTNYPGGQIPQ